MQSSHLSVDEALAALIKQRPAGDRLPAEPALAAQLGVSRATLREALRSFQERGLIVRQRGVGTFVAAPLPVIENGLEVLESLETWIARSGLEMHVEQALIEDRLPWPDELAGLGLPSPVPVLSVVRMIMANTHTVACLRDVVLIKYLRRSDLDETRPACVFEALCRSDKLALAHSRTSLAAMAADADMAGRLHIRRGMPLLKLEAQLYAQTGQIVNYSVGHFVPGYFCFHVIRRVSA